jgi:hypothetical protein
MVAFLLCPDPACGAPAEVLDRMDLPSTAGRVEHVRLQCVRRHVFFMPTPVYGRDHAPSRGMRDVDPQAVAAPTG